MPEFEAVVSETIERTYRFQADTLEDAYDITLNEDFGTPIDSEHIHTVIKSVDPLDRKE